MSRKNKGKISGFGRGVNSGVHVSTNKTGEKPEEKKPVKQKILQTIKTPDGREWHLCQDGKIWKRTKGLVTALVEDTDGFRLANGMKGFFPSTLEAYKTEDMPSREQAKWIFKNLFDLYDHEVMCWYGWTRPKKKGEERKLVFHVPKQKCTSANVSVPDEELEEMMDYMDVVGNIHSHPGNGKQTRSHTDVTDMKQSPGIHGIFSQDGILTWYASVRDEVFETAVWHLNRKELKEEKCEICTIGGVPLDERIEGPTVYNLEGSNTQTGWSNALKKWTSMSGGGALDVVPIEEACVICVHGKPKFICRKGESARARGSIYQDRNYTGNWTSLSVEEDWKKCLSKSILAESMLEAYGNDDPFDSIDIDDHDIIDLDNELAVGSDFFNPKLYMPGRSQIDDSHEDIDIIGGL